MDELRQIWEFLAPHWPGLAWFVVAAIGTQVSKNALFTKVRAHKKAKSQWVWWWGYKTLALHAVLVGGVVGLFWQNPEGASPPWPGIAAVMYFACFGGASVWAYESVKGILKKKGIDIGALPGDDGSKPRY
jgi:hypothetical protein